MRRAALFVLMALLLLTACGRLERGPIVLPDPADVARVVLTDGRTEVTSRDSALIARLLRTLEQAVPAGEAAPEEAWSVRVDFGFRSVGSRAGCSSTGAAARGFWNSPSRASGRWMLRSGTS